jgi:hypothetical protein
MTGSVARHCEPTHNWTLDSDLRCHRTTVRSTQDRRRGEPPLLNGPVTSRMISTAVFHKEFSLLRKTPDAACRILCNRRVVRQSADRCLKQHPGDSRLNSRETTGRLQFRNSSNPNPRYPDSPPVNKGSRSSTIAGKIAPRKKSAKFYRRTGTYCLTSKDIQMFGSTVYGVPGSSAQQPRERRSTDATATSLG